MSARETISKNAAFTKAGTIHSISAQAQQILQQLTLEEKASLCSGKDFWLLKSLERLQLPSIAVADGPHGLRKQGAKGDHLGAGTSVPATCFPTASALACSWDPTLLYNLGEALAEKSADENVSVLLGPGINIKRHSSCGRNFEYFSEDPLLTGELAAAMINGVQSKNVGTSLKHFAVNNQEFNRMVTNAVVDERTLREIYLKGFEIAVKKAQPWTIMSAYNRVNGTFCSEHKELLTDILRDEWGFEGLVVTDWGAMNDRVKGIAAGLDLEMPGSTGETDQQIVKAVNHGELNEAQLDKVARRVIKLMLKAKTVIKAENIDEAAHHQLARKAAAESAVLLKNNEQILPLQTSAHFAVIGEFAKTPRYQGAGSSMVNPVKLDCAYDALSEITNNKSLPYAAGYRVKGDKGNNTLDQSLIDEAVVLAKTVDIAVVFAGLPDSFEAEGFDRDHLDMPEQHNRLIRAICKANPNTVVILSNGAAVQMPWIDQPKAVLETWLAGQAGGLAVADLILGKSNPGGKLAETFPLAMADMASDRWYPGSPRQVEYREGLYVGYRYFDTVGKPVLFPFGHGLSYTRFDYSDLKTGNSLAPDQDLTLTLTITNKGQVAGYEIAQVYLHDIDSTHHKPVHELAGFSKVWLEPGESREVEIMVDRRSFAYYDTGRKDWVVEAGDFEVQVAASSQDIRLSAVVHVQSTDRPSMANKQINQIFQSMANNQKLNVTDQDFEAMLGHKAPKPDAVRPFHANSTLSEISSTFVGKKLYQSIMKKTADDTADIDETTQKLIRKILEGLPLRGLVMMSNGKMNYRFLHILIAILNKQFINAVKLIINRNK